MIQAAVAKDIDEHIDRLLADLRGVAPPLPMRAVLELRDLDLKYYSATDVSRLDGIVHKVRIAKHQILERPRLLVDVIRKLDLKALWLPDQRRIVIDSELPVPKQRWAQSHEIVHSILPWHATFTQGDQHRTLRQDCHSIIEAEANYGASRLLFMGKQFDPFIMSRFNFDDLQKIAQRFGNSLASTHWRSVSYSPYCVAGTSSVAPWKQDDNAGEVRHAFASPSFVEQFGEPSNRSLKTMIDTVIVRKRGGPCGEGEALIRCKRGEPHLFHVNCFCNQHAVLTTMTYLHQSAILG